MPLRIGNLGGTTIDVDFSFLILCALLVMRDYSSQPRLAILWIPVLLVSLLAHELAHAGTIGLLGLGSSHVILKGMGHALAISLWPQIIDAIAAHAV